MSGEPACAGAAFCTVGSGIAGKSAVCGGIGMRKYWDGFLSFYRDKRYVLLLALAAVCGYGFKVTHFTVGIDDTPSRYYFDEGLAAIVGRWVLFLLNKVVNLSRLTPFLTDFAAVLILMAAVTVWCVLFCSVLGDRVPRAGYCFFSCIFLTCPLISEVFTYYLHNGVAIGYLCSGISLCCFREGRLRGRPGYGPRRRKRDILSCYAASAVFLWIALGCYESFMVVWLAGGCLLLLTERFAGNRGGVFRAVGAAVCIAAAGLVLRSLMIAAVTGIFDLGYLKEEAIQRSVTEMAAWLFEPGAFAEFAMVLKRLFVMYGVFACAYYPIRIFVLAALLLAGYSIYRAVRDRDLWIVPLCIGAFAASFLLAIVEGKATYYRSAQFLPLICGYGALLLVYACRGLWKSGARKAARALRALPVLALCVILWNQCEDLNRWFYVDDMKYQNAKELVSQIAWELERGYDTSKPVVFTGTWEVPKGIVGDAYVEYGSETFYRMKRITDRIDEHLLEKFYRPYGVWVAQTPALSVIDWGHYAFDSDGELVSFFAMHGHELTPFTDAAVFEEAEAASAGLPHFPREGSIVDQGEYIIVHF